MRLNCKKGGMSKDLLIRNNKTINLLCVRLVVKARNRLRFNNDIFWT